MPSNASEKREVLGRAADERGFETLSPLEQDGLLVWSAYHRTLCSSSSTSELVVWLVFGSALPVLPRMSTEHAHSLTGIDIHPGARPGEKLFIDHGTGVVIGEPCIIGKRVRIYQGVTLGAKSFPLDEHGHPMEGIDRHPSVEDGVVIYAGATILGRITVGRGSSIGGSVWLTSSVPPRGNVTQAAPRESRFEGGGEPTQRRRRDPRAPARGRRRRGDRRASRVRPVGAHGGPARVRRGPGPGGYAPEGPSPGPV